MNIQNDSAAARANWSLRPPRIDRASREAHLRAVVARADELAAAARLEGLGLLSVADVRYDDHHGHVPQIRSEPLPALHGWEFRFDMPRQSAGRDAPEGAAKRLVDKASDLLTGSSRIARRLRAAREAVVRTIETADSRAAPVELVALGVSSIQGDTRLKLVADLRVLGMDLSYGIDRVQAPDAAGLAERLETLLSEHAARAGILEGNRADGSDWRIDAVAKRLLEEVGSDRRLVLSHLTRERQVAFHFGGPDGCDCKGALYWDEGTIRGDFERHGTPLRLECGTLLVEGDSLPTTVLVAAEGRRLGSVVSHPLLPADATIDTVDDQGDWIYLQLTVPCEPLAPDSFADRRAAA